MVPWSSSEINARILLLHFNGPFYCFPLLVHVDPACVHHSSLTDCLFMHTLQLLCGSNLQSLTDTWNCLWTFIPAALSSTGAARIHKWGRFMQTKVSIVLSACVSAITFPFQLFSAHTRGLTKSAFVAQQPSRRFERRGVSTPSEPRLAKLANMLRRPSASAHTSRMYLNMQETLGSCLLYSRCGCVQSRLIHAAFSVITSPNQLTGLDLVFVLLEHF